MEKITELLSKAIDQIIPWLLTHGVKVVLIIAGAYLANKIVGKFIEKLVRVAVGHGGFNSELSEKKREDTLIQIFSTTIRIVIFVIAALMVLQEFGMMIAPILAAAGIVGLAFGFGGQYLIKDIITGFFIILENQYRIGDVVKFDTLSGTVEDISLRKTTLRDLDGNVHHVPHGEVKTVSNLTRDFSRVNLDIGVAYESDLEHVIRVVNQTGTGMFEDPAWKERMITAPQFLRVEEFADSAVVIKVLGETIPINKWEVAGEFRKRIKLAFDKEGIAMPYLQMVVHQVKALEEKKPV